MKLRHQTIAEMMGCRLTPNSNAPIEELTAKSIKFHQRRVVFGVFRPPPESATRPPTRHPLETLEMSVMNETCPNINLLTRPRDSFGNNWTRIELPMIGRR